MPPPVDVLAGLTAIATDLIVVAVLVHVVLLIGLSGLVFGWRPARRTACMLLILLPTSVGVFAFLYGNAFNAVAFAVLAVWLFVGGDGGRRARSLSGQSDAALTRWIGVGLLAFGWLYPHFLDGRPALLYAVAAPTGLLPCPTLAVLIGFTLLKRNLFPLRWAVALATYGLFYGVFGAFRLGVWLDLGLVAGAAWLWRFVVISALDAD